MKNIFKNKIIMVTCICLFVFAIGITVYASQANNTFFVGQQIKELKNNDNASVIAKVGDYNITKGYFDRYKALNSVGNSMPPDSALLDKLIENEVIKEQALKEGISVSDEEVNNAIEQQKQAFANDSKSSEFLKNYIQGLGISEDQYWENMKPGIKNALIRGKYLNKNMELFKKDNPDINANEFTAKFNEFYKNKINDLKNSYKIEKYTN